MHTATFKCYFRHIAFHSCVHHKVLIKRRKKLNAKE